MVHGTQYWEKAQKVMSKKRLPKLPSALLRLAVNDLVKVERSKRYEVAMGDWHTGQCSDDVCHVCLAGSVLAKSLNIPKDADFGGVGWIYLPHGRYTELRLKALDSFRQGNIMYALRTLGSWYEKKFLGQANTDDWVEIYTVVRNQPLYSRDPGVFKSSLRRLATLLARMGL